MLDTFQVTLRLLWALALALARIVGRRIGRILSGVTGQWRRLDTRQRRIVGTLTVVLVAVPTAWIWRDAPGHWREADEGRRPLLEARSWYYHLSDIDVDRIAADRSDLVVIDYARGDGLIPLTKEEVARIKTRPDGSQRLAVSYISIGEAESYRFYWKSEWEKDKPPWHVAENCAWPRNHMVRYWHDGWKDIIYQAGGSYIQRIVDAGFDGVYLDRIDVFDNLQAERSSARKDMVAFVAALAAKGRALKPGFLVIAQNAESLLSDRNYRNVIDGLGKEDLLYGGHGTNVRNPRLESWSNIRLINKLRWDWKPVFAVEYLSLPALMDSARAELTGQGMVPAFAHRTLDGRDPTLERPPSSFKYGTAEWIAQNCRDKRHW